MKTGKMSRSLACALVCLAGSAVAAPISRLELARAVMDRYAACTAEERQAAISGLAARAETAALLVEGLERGTVARADVPGFVARQIADFKDEALTARLEKAWGRIGSRMPGHDEAGAELAKWRQVLTPAFLKGARASEGRALFQSVCGNCHTLFGAGGKVGPDLTGSNRADIGYLLDNITQPSALYGLDYELHVFALTDGRGVAGMVRKETADGWTVQTLTGEEVIPRAAVKTHEPQGISMMPAGLLAPLTPEQVRDLIGYLAGPEQVPLPGEAGADAATRVPGALEGEALRVVRSAGSAAPQDMRSWKDFRWSGGRQLWWTGAHPGDQLTLAFPVTTPGKYRIMAVFTRAPDYGTMRFSLDGAELGDKVVDLFGSRVSTTEELLLGVRELQTGEHELTITVAGAHPDAVKNYMLGLDYLQLVREEP